ncbi:MAG: hypothetical protein V1650_02785 [Candidatus Omnitrophota bacterium]
MARTGLNFIFIAILLLSGCSSSTSPTYLKENIAQTIQDICKNEYKLNVKARLVGSTIWVYLPVEEIFGENKKKKKPQKSIEKFQIEANGSRFHEEAFQVEYIIKAVPEKEKIQQFDYNEATAEKINNTWKVLRRVLFSMDSKDKNAPKFCYLVVGDIKNGYDLEQVFFEPDLKKVSYGFISFDEFQHRAIQNTNMSKEIIGDKEGAHLAYKDLSMGDFLAMQIQNRINLKFGKPEVGKNANIDKEVLKIIVYTLKLYNFKDFSFVDLYNLLTNKKSLLNKRAILSKSST